MCELTYKGKKYPARDLKVKTGHGIIDLVISVESLGNAISPDGSFDDVDEAGENLDQSIYYYIPDEDVEYLSVDAVKWAWYAGTYIDLGDWIPVIEERG